MNYPLTLNPTHRSDQATDREDGPSQHPDLLAPPRLQPTFLDSLLNQAVTIYLINGIKLIGTLKQHDLFTLLLQSTDGIDSLVFKHAINSLIPGAQVALKERRTPFRKRPEGAV